MNIKIGTLIELGGAKQSGSILVASSNSTYDGFVNGLSHFAAMRHYFRL